MIQLSWTSHQELLGVFKTHLPYGITQCYLPPGPRHKWTHLAVIPTMQANTRFTYPGWIEGWVYLLTGYIPRWFTHTQTVTHPNIPAVHSQESNSQPFDHKSDTLTITLPNHTVNIQLSGGRTCLGYFLLKWPAISASDTSVIDSIRNHIQLKIGLMLQEAPSCIFVVHKCTVLKRVLAGIICALSCHKLTCL